MIKSIRIAQVIMAAAFMLLAPAHAYAACSSPSASVGTIIYNSGESVPQYCDDTNWIAMAPLGGFNPVAVNCDGTATSLQRGGALTGVVDAKKVSGSYWARTDSAGVTEVIVQNESSRFVTQKLSTNNFHVKGHNADGDEVFIIRSATAYTDANWHHVMWSIDMDVPGSGKMYVDGVDDTNVTLFGDNDSNGGPGTDNVINFDQTEYRVCSNVGGTSAFWDGDVAELWIDFGTYIDLTVEENRRKFITANGRPAFLGKSGHLPTGNIPDLYLVGGASEFVKNKGSGGDFTLAAGTLTDAASNPGDADLGDFTTGLLGHWKLDEITFTSAADSSGNGYNGSVINGLDQSNDSTVGVRDKALTFDGTNDTIVVGSNAAFDIATNGSFSQFVWFKKTTDCGANAGGDNEVMVDRWGAGYTDRTWWFGCTASSDALTIRFYGNGGNAIVTGPVIDDGLWHHGGWVYDGTAGEVRLYLDGSEVNSASYTLDMDMNIANPICIGGYDNTCSDSRFFFDGLLDDVRVYNTALTDADVKALYVNSAKYCWDPEGIPGEMRYNYDTHTPMYCDNDHWVNTTTSLDERLQGHLFAHWKLDETSGSAIAEETGNWNGVWTDGANDDVAEETVPGKLGTALNFDGAGDVIDVASFTTPEQGTLAMWIKFDTVGTQQRFFGNHGDFEFMMWDDGSIQADIGGNSGPDSSITPVADRWYHMVWTYDENAGESRFYIDGVQDGSDSGSMTVVNTPNGLEIGDRGSNPSLDGQMDDVRFYDVVLTAAEAKQLYDQTKREYQQSLTGYWPLNESTGTTAEDIAGGHDGTFTGSAISYSSVAPKIGTTAMLFGGNADGNGIDVPSFDVSSGAITIMAWIYPFSFSDARIVSKTDGSAAADHDWMLGIDPSGSLYGRVSTAGGVQSPGNNLFTPASDENQWWHVAMTYDPTDTATEFRFYKNGVASGDYDHTAGGAIVTSTKGIGIGDQPSTASGGDRTFDGLLDDVRVYDRVLTDQEILEIYNAGNAGYAASDCTSPNAAEGTMIYNTDDNAVQYCDGSGWVKLGKR